MTRHGAAKGQRSFRLGSERRKSRSCCAKKQKTKTGTGFTAYLSTAFSVQEIMKKDRCTRTSLSGLFGRE